MKHTLSIVLVGSLLLLGGCDKKAENAGTTGTGAAGGMGNALDAAKTAATDTFTKLRDQAVATLEPKLESAKAEVTKLKDKVAGLPDAVKPTVTSGMAEVEKQLGAAGEQLTKLKSAGADTWQSISTELGAAMDKLGTAIKDLSGKFPS